MSNIWFISDTHFCHEKEFLWQPRGYKSVYQMNLDLMDKWNCSIGEKDTIYHLGDVMLNDNEEGMRILSCLKGNIHIILGNHDSLKRVELYKQLPNVVDIAYADMLYINKHINFYLSHYPTLVANFDDYKKLWNLSGHTHTTDKFALKQHQIYNVGVDAHNGYPVNLDEIIEDIRRLRRGI